MASINKSRAVRNVVFPLLLVSLGSVAVASLVRSDPAPGQLSSAHRDPAFFAETGVSGLSCARCHADYPLIVVSELGGDFTIDDCGGNMGQACGGLFKNGYTPGQTYQMRAIIAHPGMSSWGFDLWVIDKNGTTAGTLSGQQFRSATHTRTQDGIVVSAVGDEGVGHRQNGRFDGPVGWRFRWRAPDTDIGPVRFFAEGTAADRDRTVHGDYSYFLNGIEVPPAAGAK